jgi:hypothetical protein
MTKAPSSIAAVRHDHQLDGDDLGIPDLQEQNVALRAELDEVQPVVSAAVLAATAFRLRDQSGLVSALRLLVRATTWLEEQRSYG